MNTRQQILLRLSAQLLNPVLREKAHTRRRELLAEGVEVLEVTGGDLIAVFGGGPLVVEGPRHDVHIVKPFRSYRFVEGVLSVAGPCALTPKEQQIVHALKHVDVHGRHSSAHRSVVGVSVTHINLPLRGLGGFGGAWVGATTIG